MSLEGWTGLSVGLPKAERTTILYSESDTRRLAVTQVTAKASKGRAQSPLAASTGAEPCFSLREKKEYHPKGDPHAVLFV